MRVPAPEAPTPAGQTGAPARPTPPRPEIRDHKWTEADFAAASDGQMPMGEAADTSLQWSYGDVDAGFKEAALVLDETFSTAANANLPLESRSTMAYWENGKLYLHGSTQSTAQTVPAVARWVGIEPSEVVILSEYTGGGFGSKVTGSITMAIPALLSKKANAPVMMRINQEEEHYIGRVRPAFHGRVKIGFSKDGRITALDLYWLADNGPYEQQHDCGTGARMASLIYQPPAMRFRGMSMVTNTNPTEPAMYALTATPIPRAFEPVRSLERALRCSHSKSSAPRSSASFMKALVTVPRRPFAPAGPTGACPAGALIRRIST